MMSAKPYGVDMHVHAAPSIFPRSETARSLVQHAHAAGLRGVVLKAHEGSTAERAVALAESPGTMRVFGSITLNQFVGGWNATAVDLALALGARVVWAPTIHAAHHMAYYGGAQYREQAFAQPIRPSRPVETYSEDGSLLPAVYEVLEVIAHADAVFATGHLSSQEAHDVIDAAQRQGVHRIVYTHPDLPVSAISLKDQQYWARRGVWLEKSYLTVLPTWGRETFETMARSIQTLGSDQVVLQTDLGQAGSELPVQGWQTMLESLSVAGLSDSDLDRVADRNAWNLLTDH
jgi:hypothetical protein